jgi:hypothetical protein
VAIEIEAVRLASDDDEDRGSPRALSLNPGEPSCSGSTRTVEGGESRRAREAVARQSGPSLEAAERNLAASAQAAVQWSRGQSLEAEKKLQFRDIPAEVAGHENARTQSVPPVAAQCAAGEGTRDPIRDEAMSSLEKADSGNGLGSEQAVDRRGVEAAGVQCDLQGRNA